VLITKKSLFWVRVIIEVMTYNRVIKFTGVMIACLALLFYVHTAFAQIDNLPSIPGKGSTSDIKSLTDLIGYIYNLAFWIVGIAVFVNILWGGFIVFFGAAGNSSKVSEGTKKITNAVYGLVLLVAAYLILNTINPDLVKNTFDFGTLLQGGGQ